jgi:plastocyanin
MMRTTHRALLISSLTIGLSGAAGAGTIEIKAQGVRFVPEIVRAKVGDTLAFRTMATQFVEPVAGMWPEGAPEIRSEPGADFDYTATEQGVYVVKSTPHWGAHMGVVIIVGKPPDVDATIERYLTITANDRATKPAATLLRRFQEEAVKR